MESALRDFEHTNYFGQTGPHLDITACVIRNNGTSWVSSMSFAWIFVITTARSLASSRDTFSAWYHATFSEQESARNPGRAALVLFACRQPKGDTEADASNPTFG